MKFDATSGKILSAVRTGGTAAPTLVAGKVVVPRRSDIGGQVRESISVQTKNLEEEKVYNDVVATYLDYSVQRLSSMDKKAEELDAGNGFGAAPAASGYVAASANVGQARVSTMQAFQGSRILHRNGFNYNCMGDELFCTNMKTGEKAWSVKLKGDLKKVGGFLGTPPVLAGDRLILATYDGRILLIDPDKGEITKEYRVEGNIRFQPIVVDGLIYAGTQQGRMICIDTGDKKLTGWPMWGGNAQHTGSPTAPKKATSSAKAE